MRVIKSLLWGLIAGGIIYAIAFFLFQFSIGSSLVGYYLMLLSAPVALIGGLVVAVKAYRDYFFYD